MSLYAWLAIGSSLVGVIAIGALVAHWFGTRLERTEREFKPIAGEPYTGNGIPFGERTIIPTPASSATAAETIAHYEANGYRVERVTVDAKGRVHSVCVSNPGRMDGQTTEESKMNPKLRQIIGLAVHRAVNQAGSLHPDTIAALATHEIETGMAAHRLEVRPVQEREFRDRRGTEQAAAGRIPAETLASQAVHEVETGMAALARRFDRLAVSLTDQIVPHEMRLDRIEDQLRALNAADERAARDEASPAEAEAAETESLAHQVERLGERVHHAFRRIEGTERALTSLADKVNDIDAACHGTFGSLRVAQYALKRNIQERR